MLPLVKIPCILVAMVGFHVTATAPNPPPRKVEEAKSTRLEGVLKSRKPFDAIKVVYWGVAIAEISVILSREAPSSPISQTILSNLMLVDGGERHIRPSTSFLIGALLTALGGYIRRRCYRELGRLYTWEMSIRTDHRLVTTGPYSIVRHPGYTGFTLATCGSVCMLAGPGSWLRESGALDTSIAKGILYTCVGILSSVALGMFRRIPKEDEAMHDLFGKKWEDWARNVPYRLIPFVY